MSDFVDEAVLHVKAGDGGDGTVSLHREKYNPKGGPDGGDGGRGGDVILVATAGMSSLIDFRYRSTFKAGSGDAGGTNRRTGRSGRDTRIKVPVGCAIYDEESRELYGELVAPRQEFVIAVGGEGGRGNAGFTTSTRQTPQFCERGEPGEEARIRLELKLLADIGLVGLPNAGKSSLLRVASAAKPKVASYPFTTLQPILGVYRAGEDESYVIADIPGLIEGAHEGVGLGDGFLKHLERTRALIHMLDVSLIERGDPVADYLTIRRELEAYGRGLAELPAVVGLNKMDISDDEVVDLVEEELRKAGCEFEMFRLSAGTGQGVEPLVGAAVRHVRYLRRDEVDPEEEAPKRQYRPAPAPRPLVVEGPIELTDEEGAGLLFQVSGDEVERVMRRTHLNNPEAILYLHRQLVDLGVLDRLEARGAREGDTVRIGDVELEYIDSAYVREE
ncbi:MAG: GTPase ObgE [Armatimonadia bacterium]|nr:GTPase ObgE [Armatimonadia bacterium]